MRTRLVGTLLGLAFGIAAAGCGGGSSGGGTEPPPTPGLSTIVNGGALSVSEAGTTATFTVALRVAPTAAVTVTVTSSDPTEVAVAPATLTFDAGNWSIPQTVTLTGVNDDLADGTKAVSLSLTPASADAAYEAATHPSLVAALTATNADDDSLDFIVSRTTASTVENGAAESFTVRLGAAPASGTVVIGIVSGDTSEGTVSPTPLTFTTSDWSTPRTVTVTPVDDFVQDGAMAYTVTVSVTSADDAAFGALAARTIAVTNEDDDVPGFTLSVAELYTQETGGSPQTFTVRLNTLPSANVSFAVLAEDGSEGSASPATLTFTTANWSTPQTVTVTPLHDFAVDGAQIYQVALTPSSADLVYGAMATRRIWISNADTDVAGVTLSRASVSTSETGVAGTFTVALNTIPSSTVTYAVASGNTNEGTVSPASLTFYQATWNVPQTVTVTPVHDFVADGPVAYGVTLTPSGEAHYVGVGTKTVSVTNYDADTAGLVVNAPNLQTSEPNVARTVTVALSSKPTANVTVGVVSSDTAEGTVSPASLTFTTANWSTAQTVTVTGVNDDYVDGAVAYAVTLSPSSSDPKYTVSYLSATVLNFTNADDDVAGFDLSKTTVAVAEGGSTDSFTVKLKAKPSSNVVVHAEPTVNQARVNGSNVGVLLTFNGANWNVPQTVTVAAIDDCYKDPNAAFEVRVFTDNTIDTDWVFRNRTAPAITGTAADNEPAPAIIVTPTTLSVSERLGMGGSVTTGSFNVKLTTCPWPNKYVAIGTGGTLNWVAVAKDWTLANYLDGTNYATGFNFTVTPTTDSYNPPASGQYVSIVTVSQVATGSPSIFPDSPDYVGLSGSSVTVYNTVTSW